MCICGELLTILNMMAANLESTALRAQPKPQAAKAAGRQLAGRCIGLT
jgi:hypothetical protein